MNPSTAQTWFKIGVAVFQILAILCVVGAYLYSKKTTENQSQEGKAQRDRLEKLAEDNLKISKGLQSQLQGIATSKHDELIKKYPQGYLLFGVDRQEIIIPYKSKLKSDFRIDWSKAKIVELTPQRITMQLPDIYATSGGGIFSCFSGNARYVGSINRAFKFGSIGIITEIISDDQNGIVFVLGFE